MARREWGWICPEDQGLLVSRPEWEARGVMWCPNEDTHGGNGRFWRTNEVEEGWFDPTRPPEPTEAQIARQARAAEQSAKWHEHLEAKQAETRKARRMTDTTTTKVKEVKPPQNCLCGCGGQTKGGRFLPGHDARYHARVKTLTGSFGMGLDEAQKIASQGPLANKYAAKPKASTNGTEPTPITAAKGGKAKRTKAPDLTAKATDDPAPEAETPEQGEGFTV